MATQNITSNISTIQGKKILQYPLGLGSVEKDRYGDDNQYMLFKINTDEKTTKLKEDKQSSDVVMTSTRVGTGVGVKVDPALKNTDKDLNQQYGADAVNKENWFIQKGMVRLDKVIVLPMPNEHQVGTRVTYEEVDQTTLTKLGDFLNNGVGDNIKDLYKLGKNAGISALVNVVKSGATNTGALLAEEKLAFNPKKEVMFQSFGFRKFTFSYNFAPKSEAESDMIEDIIETFRYYSLPEIYAGKMFYILPSEFEVSFMKGSKNNPHIPKIATSVLERVNVNYSPNNVWATLPNGAPVALSMTLDFLELEMIDRSRIYNPESIIKSGY